MYKWQTQSNKEVMLLQFLVTLALLQLVQLQLQGITNASTITGLYWVLEMPCNFTGAFCYEQVMEVGSVWAGKSLSSLELRLSPSETSSTYGRTPPSPSSRHTSLTKVGIPDTKTGRQTDYFTHLLIGNTHCFTHRCETMSLHNWY